MYLSVPLPQNYRLLVYARFSKGEQRQQSIADQDDFCREFLNDNGPKPGSSQLLSDEGISGELHSRPGIDLVRAGIRDRRWDLIVVEDSSRLFRGVAPCMDLVGWAVDQRIRVICINDFVDTANEDWQQRLEEAQRHHGQANYYIRFRIKRSHDGLWRIGAAIGPLRPGYRRYKQNPDSPKSPKFDEIDPQWMTTIIEAFQMVAMEIPLEDVAAYLTQAGLPKVSNALTSRWTVRNVLGLIRCEQYRGVQYFRKEVSTKKFRTGQSKSIRNPNPEKIEQREMPHLRMVEDWLWYLANEVIDGRARPSVPRSGPDHPLFGVPRNSRSLLSNVFVCGICGSKMYAEGRNEGGYRCSAARRKNCWNKATCLRDLTHQRICTSVSEALLLASPEVMDVLIEQVQSLLADQDQLREELRKLTKQRADLRLGQQRLVDAITDSESRPAFVAEAIANLAAEEMNVSRDEQRLTSQLSERRAVPERDVIEQRIRELSLCMNTEPERAKALLPQLLDGPIRAVPYQPLGNKNVVLKAEFTLRLAQLLPDELRLMLSTAADTFIAHPLMKREQTVELFQRSKSQEFAVQALAFYRASESPPTLEQLGAHLGISKWTAHLALQLGNQLNAIGLSDPFIRLSKCPPAPARWRFKDAS